MPAPVATPLSHAASPSSTPMFLLPQLALDEFQQQQNIVHKQTNKRHSQVHVWKLLSHVCCRRQPDNCISGALEMESLIMHREMLMLQCLYRADIFNLVCHNQNEQQ